MLVVIRRAIYVNIGSKLLWWNYFLLRVDHTGGIREALKESGDDSWGRSSVYSCEDLRLLDLIDFASMFCIFLLIIIIFLWYTHLVTFARAPFCVCVKAFLKYVLLISSFFFRHAPQPQNLPTRGSVHELRGWAQAPWDSVELFMCENIFCTCVVVFWVYSLRFLQGFWTTEVSVLTETQLSRAIKLKSLWMALWLIAPDAETSSLEK